MEGRREKVSPYIIIGKYKKLQPFCKNIEGKLWRKKWVYKIILKNFECDFYKPYVALKCCSVETNFGNNLKEKPFIYKIKNNFNHFSVNFDGEDESLDFDGELTKEETEINGSAGNVSN
uniref:Uncharacterized protein n=1 Tax=Meloidogyne enterolobii TaxID=390850 RepID=A0A6V7TKB7_MELEN|nr:unnamed protein product [Meloidogyne enterolobii]